MLLVNVDRQVFCSQTNLSLFSSFAMLLTVNLGKLLYQFIFLSVKLEKIVSTSLN